MLTIFGPNFPKSVCYRALLEARNSKVRALTTTETICAYCRGVEVVNYKTTRGFLPCCAHPSF
jgi:hypothetical protein